MDQVLLVLQDCLLVLVLQRVLYLQVVPLGLAILGVPEDQLLHFCHLLQAPLLALSFLVDLLDQYGQEFLSVLAIPELQVFLHLLFSLWDQVDLPDLCLHFALLAQVAHQPQAFLFLREGQALQ